VRVEAVDPDNPERPVVSEHDETGVDRVWVSDDRAQTFRPWAELSDFGVLVFDGDGRVWLGDWGDTGSPVPSRGLLTAANLDEAPAVIADYPVHCLAYAPSTDTLYGCQRFWIGTIDTETGAFETTFTLGDTVDFVECTEDAASACEETLCQAYCGPGSFPVAPICEAYDGPSCGPCAIADPELRPADCDVAIEPGDAGAHEASGETMDAGGCGCVIAGGRRPSTGGAGVLLIAFMALAIRRSMRPAGSKRT